MSEHLIEDPAAVPTSGQIYFGSLICNGTKSPVLAAIAALSAGPSQAYRSCCRTAMRPNTESGQEQSSPYWAFGAFQSI